MTQHSSDAQGKRNAALMQLDAFVGEWQVEVAVGGQPVGQARTVFSWLEDGVFLVERSEVPHPDVPNVVAIMHGDDTTGSYCRFHQDSRGVSRIYQMSLNDGVWKLWREAPGFSQRFTSTFSDDGKTIRGSWETSSDGMQWKHDFDITYTKLSRPQIYN